MTAELELEDYKNSLKDDDPQKIICKVLCNLSSNLNESNEIFLSEADFQFSFAQELDKVLSKEKGIKSPRIILEYPFLTKDLYKEDNNKKGDNPDYDSEYCKYLKDKMCNKCRKKEKDKEKCQNDQKDICFKKKHLSIDLYYEYEGKAVYIEFKYKTKGISGVKRGSTEEFTLKDHSNVTEQRQGLYKDIERIEHCLKWHKEQSEEQSEEHPEKHSKTGFGYVIFMTNNKSHWDPKSTVEKYRLCNGIARKYEIPQQDEYVCTTKDHKLTWHPFTTENQENKQFKVCLIDCNNAE